MEEKITTRLLHFRHFFYDLRDQYHTQELSPSSLWLSDVHKHKYFTGISSPYSAPKNLEAVETWKKTLTNPYVSDHKFINQCIFINGYSKRIVLVLIFTLAVHFFSNKGSPDILLHIKPTKERVKRHLRVCSIDCKLHVVFNWTWKICN